MFFVDEFRKKCRIYGISRYTGWIVRNNIIYPSFFTNSEELFEYRAFIFFLGAFTFFQYDGMIPVFLCECLTVLSLCFERYLLSIFSIRRFSKVNDTSFLIHRVNN